MPKFTDEQIELKPTSEKSQENIDKSKDKKHNISI